MRRLENSIGSRSTKFAKLVLFAGIPAALLGGFLGFNRLARNSRSGPVHTYTIQPTPPFLTDDLALEKARQTLALDGYDTSAWQPSKDDRSKAPDGTPDAYLVRNAINPNDGWVMFLDTTGRDPNPSRVVTVELKADRLECVVVRPK